MSKIKAIIFDFDGTIADSFEVFVEVLSDTINHKFDSQEITRLRGFSTRKIMHELGIKNRQLPMLAIKGKRALGNKMERVKPFHGMDKVLKNFHDKGYKVYILSTNNSKNISGFLGKYGFDTFVDAVYSDIGIFGKVKYLKRLMRQQSLKPSECLYIGDETRDIEAAHKVGMKCISVSWGYGLPDTLETYHPDMLVNRPAEIVGVINNL
jgi:phosphoglycolate phosphatase